MRVRVRVRVGVRVRVSDDPCSSIKINEVSQRQHGGLGDRPSVRVRVRVRG